MLTLESRTVGGILLGPAVSQREKLTPAKAADTNKLGSSKVHKTGLSVPVRVCVATHSNSSIRSLGKDELTMRRRKPLKRILEQLQKAEELILARAEPGRTMNRDCLCIGPSRFNFQAIVGAQSHLVSTPLTAQHRFGHICTSAVLCSPSSQVASFSSLSV